MGAERLNHGRTNSGESGEGLDLLKELENNGELAMLVSAPPIVFSPIYVDITGSVTAALLLSACAQDTEAMTEGGWTELNSDRWLKQTRLSIAELRTARKTLKELSLLDERRYGFPAKSEYRIDFAKLTSKIVALAQSHQAARKQYEQLASNFAVTMH